MIKRFVPSVALFALLPVSAPLQAQAGGPGQSCPDGYEVTARQSAGQAFDPNDMARSVLRISLQAVRADVPQGCRGQMVTITPQFGASFALANGANTLDFTVINSGQVSQANAMRIVLSGQARNRLVDGETVDIDLFELTAGQFPVAGEYQGTILVQVGNGPQVPVVLTTNVRPAIRFAVENGSPIRDIDFGEVTAGVTIRSPVFYRSNAAVAVTIQSLNQGRMVHEGGLALGSIPYDVTYDGTPVDLATAARIDRPSTGLATRREDVVFRVAPQDALYAGRYRDVLTVSYTAF